MKFENLSAYYGWDETDRLCHLKASLSGPASCMLWELPNNCTATELIALMRNRYGSQDMIEKFRYELKTRRRRKNETIQSLFQDVCRLLALSYPGETSSLSQTIFRDAFLDSLNDPEMRIRILERGATTISEAYTFCARREAFVASGDTEREGGGGDDRRRARFVKQEQRGGPPDDQRFSRLQSEIASCRQQLQQLQSNGVAAASPSDYASGSMRYSFPVDSQQLQQQTPMQP